MSPYSSVFCLVGCILNRHQRSNLVGKCKKMYLTILSGKYYGMTELSGDASNGTFLAYLILLNWKYTGTNCGSLFKKIFWRLFFFLYITTYNACQLQKQIVIKHIQWIIIGSGGKNRKWKLRRICSIYLVHVYV